jgi:hypothetical protein
MPDDEYPPDSIRVLAGLEPRPQGELVGIEPEYWWASIDGVGPLPVAVWRDAGDSEDPPQPWGAERLGVEGVLWPDRVRLIARALPPGGRIALPVEDLSDRETDPTIPPPGDNPQGLATFDPMEHPSYRTAARTFLDGYLQSRGIAPCEWPEDQGAADVVGEARYSVEDGPGSGTRVELSVSVLVGTERSTVFVVDPLTGRALARELVHHGGEAGAAAVAVSAALRRCLPGAPGGVAGGSREAAGEPIE